MIDYGKEIIGEGVNVEKKKKITLSEAKEKIDELIEKAKENRAKILGTEMSKEEEFELSKHFWRVIRNTFEVMNQVRGKELSLNWNMESPLDKENARYQLDMLKRICETCSLKSSMCSSCFWHKRIETLKHYVT